jgi:hypothetical protein
LPCRVIQFATTAFLVAFSRSFLSLLAGWQHTVPTVDMTAITMTTDQRLCMASGTVVEPCCIVNQCRIRRAHNDRLLRLRSFHLTQCLIDTAQTIFRSSVVKTKPTTWVAARVLTTLPLQISGCHANKPFSRSVKERLIHSLNGLR